ncbi:diphosphomevalonate decarboxylase [Salinisphaera sp. P385]|uniref:diphosphomevalonate decarboxylase n=1 Tax=Spectribacter acetivorans TaxID=3075603 RepID=A0ABU3BC71_9GAMM|nr:diphosphomevalonate decarboxylase [Salinisphaera sp. P385]MDT0619710.1 diphosphomevalonate decarboxylase [Salinisphaera sp. P385]
MQAAARAHANIALIKYWGKRDSALNLPATGSISVTLEALHSETRVRFDPNLVTDAIMLESGGDAERVSRFLDLVRALAGMEMRADVRSRNNFPTGAGLASSASGFAALALAASRAAGIEASPSELSALARQGSGSAARSLYGGFVEMQRGRDDRTGADAHAVPLLAAHEWPLAVVVAIIDTGTKSVGSTDGMTRTAATSPFHDAWVAGADADLAAMRTAIRDRNLERVGELTEHSCLKMHATMLGAQPGLIYWQPATLAAWQTLADLRADGLAAYGTIDAGPQVKALCRIADADAVTAALAQVPGVRDVRISHLGPDASLIADPWA